MEGRFLLPAVVALLLVGPAAADEGFWTFNNFPAQKVQDAYGFLPSPEWLDHVRYACRDGVQRALFQIRASC
jgi:hypothetical protein